LFRNKAKIQNSIIFGGFEALKEEIKDHKQTELELQEQSFGKSLESIDKSHTFN
jgi:hypothetical protein